MAGLIAQVEGLPGWLRALPAVNAGLNGLATLLLLGGWVLIRRGNRGGHKRAMLTAFAVSILFLLSYLTYHVGLKSYTGLSGKRFEGPAAVRGVYLGILGTHVVLAAVVPVLAVMTILRGLKAERSGGDWSGHRRIARWTFPIWLYVSITGVVIYVMLYQIPWNR